MLGVCFVFSPGVGHGLYGKHSSVEGMWYTNCMTFSGIFIELFSLDIHNVLIEFGAILSCLQKSTSGHFVLVIIDSQCQSTWFVKIASTFRSKKKK